MRACRPVVPALLALAMTLATPGVPAADVPEKTRVVIGLGGQSLSYLTIQLAAAAGPREGALVIEPVTLQGGSQAATAVAGGSVDIGMASLDTLVTALGSGQPLRAFYAGFNFAELEWFAQPSIRSWSDMKGRTVGVSALGSLSDFLTRHALRRHGLEAGRDVQVLASGGPGLRWQALRAGRIDATILAAPARWQAEAEGFTRLGTQTAEVAPQWPTNVMFARAEFLDRHPKAVQAVLRAHVVALRRARADREGAVRLLMRYLKLERREADRLYEEGIGSFDERGALPAGAMPVFWQIAVAAGEVTEAWPESRFLDRRFIDTFEQWAPR